MFLQIFCVGCARPMAMMELMPYANTQGAVMAICQACKPHLPDKILDYMNRKRRAEDKLNTEFSKLMENF